MTFDWMHLVHRCGTAVIKLVPTFEQWAENRKAAELTLGVTSGEALALVDRMRKKMGVTNGEFSMVLDQLRGHRDQHLLRRSAGQR